MIPFILYIIKLSCCLTLFCVGYKLLLSHETFFHFNRKILLTGMLTCMLLPLINIRTEAAGIIQLPMIQLEKIMTEEENFSAFTAYDEIVHSPIPAGKPIPPISLANLLALIFVTGSCIHLCLLIRSHISLCLLIRSGRKIKRGDCTIVLFDRPVTPFNYGNYIILSERDYKENPDTILTHELAHFHLLHSFDIAFVELLTLFQWFNPFVWLLKKEIRKVHEFQADAEVLQTGVDSTKYQLLLVKKAVESRPYAFANSFNHSKLKNIKNRFTMMTKKKSNSWARMKLLLFLPVAALSVYACARPNDATRQSEPVIRSEETTSPSNNQYHTISISENPTEKYSVFIAFIDATGKEVRSFTLDNKEPVSDSFPLDHTEFINEIQEWLKSPGGESPFSTVSIKASHNTTMGVITDLKQVLRDYYALKIKYALH